MSITATIPESPYKGLAPFDDSELDALLFFGREREREIVVANLVASRLTILYGPSGVGKTSLLRAAVARDLRALPERPVVAVHSDWAEDPAPALAASIAEQAELEQAPSLVETVEAAVIERGEIYLILDQLEEYFLYHGGERDPWSLAQALPELVMRTELPVHVLLGVREDAVARLDLFRARLPLLFQNQLRLDHLDREAGRRAILGPLERFAELSPEAEAVTIEPQLVDAVLDGVEAGKVVHGPGGRGVVKDASRARFVETPYLQLVLQRLWEEEREHGSAVLRLETLELLGGASRVVEDHLERALGGLSPAEKETAAAVFNHLVTPSGTKIAHEVGDLASYAGIPEGELAPVLRTLATERIVKAVAVDGGDRGAYEIFHDVLAAAVLGWRTRFRSEQALAVEREAASRRHRRLATAAGVSLVAFLAMALVTAFALSERSNARSRARTAHARELAATANALLLRDPAQSVALAARAARLLSKNAQIEDDLRRALLESHERLVVRPRGGVVAAAYSRDGERFLVAGRDGTVQLFGARRGRVLRTLAHGSPLVAASFSHDGRLVLTAGGRTIKVWAARSGRLVATLRSSGLVNSAAFGPFGGRVIAAGDDGVARVWTLAGRVVAALRNPGPVRVAALSPDGKLAVTLAEDADGHVQARLFDLDSARVLHVLPERGMLAVMFSPDGKLLATGSADRTARLWNPRTGRQLHVLEHKGHVVDVVFSPKGKYLATASEDGATRLWRVAGGERLLLVLGPTNFVESVAFSRDGNLFVVSSLDRTARVYQTEDGRELSVLRGHTDGVVSAAFSPDARSVITAGQDGTARIWDAGRPDQLRLLGAHAGPVVAAAFSPDGRLAISAGDDGTAKIWNVETRRRVRTLRHGGRLTAAAFSPDGRLALTASRDGVVRVWDVARGVTVGRFEAGAAVRTATFADGGKLVVAASADGQTRMWETEGGRLRHVFRQQRLDGAAVAPDGTAVVTWGGSTARVWHVGDDDAPRVLRGHRGAVVGASFSPDATRVVTASEDGTARIWDALTGRLLHTLTGHRAALTDAQFSGDGATVATASLDTDARTWDAETGRALEVLRGHFSSVSSASFSPDGRWVVTASATTAGLWRTTTGRLLFYLRGHEGRLTSASFSPDGTRILTASEDRTVRVYDCEICPGIPGLLALAERRLRSTSLR